MRPQREPAGFGSGPPAAFKRFAGPSDFASPGTAAAELLPAKIITPLADAGALGVQGEDLR
jgi:hypothetical protein